MSFTSDERRLQLTSYAAACDLLDSALTQFPRHMWQYRPAPERWTIHEILVHIADSEANSYVRCRRFIAEPGSPVLGYDEAGWASALHYHQQDPAEAVELFKHLRRASYQLVQDLPEATWSNTVIHSESGLMTMDRWLEIYARHIPDHINQMQAVYEDWLAGR